MQKITNKNRAFDSMNKKAIQYSKQIQKEKYFNNKFNLFNDPFTLI